MNKQFCETCPMAGSCGSEFISSLKPLGYRQIGSFVETKPQAVLTTNLGGISQPFYIGKAIYNDPAILEQQLDRIVADINVCKGPTEFKANKLVRFILKESRTECSVIGSGYTTLADSTHALRFNEDELSKMTVPAIVAKYFVAAAQGN